MRELSERFHNPVDGSDNRVVNGFLVFLENIFLFQRTELAARLLFCHMVSFVLIIEFDDKAGSTDFKVGAFLHTIISEI